MWAFGSAHTAVILAEAHLWRLECPSRNPMYDGGQAASSSAHELELMR